MPCPGDAYRSWPYAHESTRSRERPVDPAGQTAAIVAVASLAAAMIEGGSVGWGRPLIIAGFALFVVSGASFVAIGARRTHPMLPLSFFRNPTFGAAVGCPCSAPSSQIGSNSFAACTRPCAFPSW
jgi:hypothetical protein